MNFSKTPIEFFKVVRCSKLFQPTNIIPKSRTEPTLKSSLMSKSQKLLIDLGIIKQSSAGVFHLLPLGIRSMNKLKSLINRYMSLNDIQEIKMPAIVDGSLWKKSDRWDSAGTEIFKFHDRHGRDYILSPTNEESVTDLVANLGILTPQHLPIILYQIASKFRDEIKPRCGLIKSKEFEMMDAYSFDENLEKSRNTYKQISTIFDRIFNHLELPFIKVLADPGNMGGELSHEYHLISDVGEDELKICQNCSQGFNMEYMNNACPSCGSTEFKQLTGIEVGHTFLLGTRYSTPLECKFRTKDGHAEPLIMASYGLGLTRIIAASVELLSSTEEIRWPSSIAPFSICIIPPKEGSKECGIGNSLTSELCQELMKIVPDDILLDDRDNQTIGKRVRHARRTGYPYIICLGKGVLESPPLLEIISTINNTTELFTLSDVVKYFEGFQLQSNVARSVF